MPRLKHFYGQNHLHYLTANTYRKARIFDSDRYKRKFVQTLDDLRTELGFRIVGYVLMPEHSHLLIWPGSLDGEPFPNHAEALGTHGQFHPPQPA
jgi:REP element-mobilizing transposase RayT